jgi:hypothetical protein
MINFIKDIKYVLRSVHPDVYISSESKKYFNNITNSLCHGLIKSIEDENDILSSYKKVLGNDLFEHAKKLCVNKNNWTFSINPNIINNIAKQHNIHLNKEDIMITRCFIEYILTELLEIIGVETRDNNKSIINNNFIYDAIIKDDEIMKLFSLLNIPLPTKSVKRSRSKSRKSRSKRNRKSRNKRSRSRKSRSRRLRNRKSRSRRSRRSKRSRKSRRSRSRKSRRSRSRKSRRSKRSRSRKSRSKRSKNRRSRRSRKSRKSKKSLEEMSDIEFMFVQTVKGLKSYIESKGLKVPNVNKSKLVDYILNKIDINTGKLK